MKQKFIKKALEKELNNPNYLYQTALSINNYNEKKALELIKKAVKIDPKNSTF